MGKISTLYNTVKYLKPKQVLGRIECKFKKKVMTRGTECPEVKWLDMTILEIDLNQDFLCRFNPEVMLEGKVSLLNQEVELNYKNDYAFSLSPLMRNNLYYMEYAIVLGAIFRKTGDRQYVDAFIRCYSDYLSEKISIGSYICALHIPNTLIALSLFGESIEDDFRRKVACELYAQYIFLKDHLETHLLANHYLEDLKALVMASYAFGHHKECEKWCKLLEAQVKEQTNTDGLNFELSAMYHKIILEDLLRLAKLTQYADFPDLPWLKPVICKMMDAALTVEEGLSRTPLFNDAGDNVAKPLYALKDAVWSVCSYKSSKKNELPTSGYYRIENGNKVVIFDAGYIGPDYQPGHVHCDCLSFEMSINGQPIFVNAGTMLYQGQERSYFRSTRAHNTLVIDGHEQSQCWGEHRVAKRLKKVSAQRLNNGIEAYCVNYLGEIHNRKILLSEDTFTIEDSTPSSAGKDVRSFLHIAEGLEVIQNGDRVDIVNVCSIVATNANVCLHTDDELSWYSPEFGKKLQGACLEFTWIADEREHGYKIIFS